MTREEGDFLANCRLGRIEECRIALAKGVDPNCVDIKGRGAFAKVLVRRGERELPELVKLLLEYGANPTRWEHHPLILRFTGGPALSSSLQALRDSFAPAIADLEGKGIAFSFLKPDDIDKCLLLKLPPTICDFYKFAFPLSTPLGIDFLNAAEIKFYIDQPSESGLAQAGLIPIATNFSGESYCVDGNSCRSFHESPVYRFGIGYYEDGYPNILNEALQKWSSLREFLYHATEKDDQQGAS